VGGGNEHVLRTNRRHVMLPTTPPDHLRWGLHQRHELDVVVAYVDKFIALPQAPGKALDTMTTLQLPSGYTYHGSTRYHSTWA
jgi:hypothetical protein